MKFDTIIIGGGLAGLTAGIRLASAGRHTAVVSKGESALNFCSGSLGLLANTEGETVMSAVEAVEKLETFHPYRKMGTGFFVRYAEETPRFLDRAALRFNGRYDRNHFTFTPFGNVIPAWLTLDGFASFDDLAEISGSRYLIISLKGYLESYPLLVHDNLKKYGAECRVEQIELDGITRLRDLGFDMRTISVAKRMDRKAISEFAEKISGIVGEGETVLIPAVVGLESGDQIDVLRKMVGCRLFMLPTLPVSAAGFRMQNALRYRFEEAGGIIFAGDTVTAGEFEGSRLKNVSTAKLGSDRLYADDFIIASGSFFSEGIVSSPDGFREPVFGLDVCGPSDRDSGFSKDFFAPQPYQKAGVRTDSDFHVFRNGSRVENLYGVGSIMGGFDSLSEGSGAGISILSGLFVADEIIAV